MKSLIFADADMNNNPTQVNRIGRIKGISGELVQYPSRQNANCGNQRVYHQISNSAKEKKTLDRFIFFVLFLTLDKTISTFDPTLLEQLIKHNVTH